MGFSSSIANTGVWVHPAVNIDSKKYNEYVLVYVDDILGIIINTKEVLL